MAEGDYFNPRMYVEQRFFNHFDGFLGHSVTYCRGPGTCKGFGAGCREVQGMRV